MLETTITVYYYTNKRYPFERKKKSKITPTQFTTTTNEHDPLIFWHWRRKRKRKRKKSFLCWELIAHSCEMKSKTWKMMESRKLGTSKHKKWDPLQLYLRRTDTIQHNLQCFHDRKGKKKTLVANNISHGKYNKCFSFSAEKFLCFSFIFLFFFSFFLPKPFTTFQAFYSSLTATSSHHKPPLFSVETPRREGPFNQSGIFELASQFW